MFKEFQGCSKFFVESIKKVGKSGWHCSRCLFRRLTGNNRYFYHSFSPLLPFSVTTFSHRVALWIKKLLQQNFKTFLKTYFLGFWPFLVTLNHSASAILAAILDFAGGAALLAVSKCPLRRQAGIQFKVIFLQR